MAKLTASDAASYDYFGWSCGPSPGDTIVVGARYADYAGSGFSIRLPHERRRRHVRREGQADGRRRRGVLLLRRSSRAIDGDTIVVGADATATRDVKALGQATAAYVFRTSDGGDPRDRGLAAVNGNDACTVDLVAITLANFRPIGRRIH